MHCGLVAEIISFHVANGNGQDFFLRTRVGKRSSNILHSHLHRFADVLQTGVAHQSSRQKPGFAEDLKTIADSQHQTTAIGKAAYRFHHGRKLRDCPGTEVISKSKPAGDHDRIAIFQVVRFMPKKSYGLRSNLLNGPVRIMIAVRAGEDDDSEFHRLSLLENYAKSTTASSQAKRLRGYALVSAPGNPDSRATPA